MLDTGVLHVPHSHAHICMYYARACATRTHSMVMSSSTWDAALTLHISGVSTFDNQTQWDKDDILIIAINYAYQDDWIVATQAY